MVATWNPSADAGYYTHHYYLGSAEAHDAWFAPAEALGVATGSSIDPATFVRLFEARGPDGRSLVSKAGRQDRVAAFDITLSAPRSVALVWALAAPDLKAQIEAAQRRAVVATLTMLDREATFARRGKGGAIVEKVRATAAMFLHFESRPAHHDDGLFFPDPNLHTHSVFLNLARRPDNSFGAIHSTLLRDFKMAAGSVFHAALSCELQLLGFGIDRVGKNGIFEITGVADNVIRYFSARRNEIEDELAASGTTSAADPAMASSVAKKTRGAKARSHQIDREDVWRDAAESFQIRTGLFSESLREVSIERDEATAEAAFAIRLSEALEELTATESVVRRQDVIRSVASAMVGTGLPVERVADEVNRSIADGRVVQVGLDPIGLPLYSTPELIVIEQSIVEMASRLAKRGSFALDTRDVTKRSELDGLSVEQADAVLAMTLGDGIAVVEGSAGSGKTTLLRAVVTSYKAEGYRVLGAAMAWQAAHVLKRDLGIDARSTASLLNQITIGKVALDPRTILVVDEAGLIGSRDMAALLHEVEYAGAKLILVGDRRQLQPVGAGPALGIVAGVVEAKRVDSIVRQNEEWARAAVADFRDGRAAEALEAFSQRDLFVETTSAGAAIVAAVDAWEQTPADQSKLLIAKTNVQVAALSREVRARMRKNGELQGEDIAVPAVTPSGHAVEVALAVGDRIRFQVRNDTLKVVNGTTAVVTGIRRRSTRAAPMERGISIEASIDGRQVVFCPADLADDRGRAPLGYAYATTLYGSQGLTVDRAAVLLDAAFDRHDAYVAASRARRETKLVVDAKAIDRQLKGNSLQDKRASALVTKEDRFSWLAARLARENRKVSTVEVIAAEKNRQRDARLPDRERIKAARSKVREHALEI